MTSPADQHVKHVSTPQQRFETVPIFGENGLHHPTATIYTTADPADPNTEFILLPHVSENELPETVLARHGMSLSSSILELGLTDHHVYASLNKVGLHTVGDLLRRPMDGLPDEPSVRSAVVSALAGHGLTLPNASKRPDELAHLLAQRKRAWESHREQHQAAASLGEQFSCTYAVFGAAAPDDGVIQSEWWGQQIARRLDAAPIKRIVLVSPDRELTTLAKMSPALRGRIISGVTTISLPGPQPPEVKTLLGNQATRVVDHGESGYPSLHEFCDPDSTVRQQLAQDHAADLSYLATTRENELAEQLDRATEVAEEMGDPATQALVRMFNRRVDGAPRLRSDDADEHVIAVSTSSNGQLESVSTIDISTTIHDYLSSGGAECSVIYYADAAHVPTDERRFCDVAALLLRGKARTTISTEHVELLRQTINPADPGLPTRAEFEQAFALMQDGGQDEALADVVLNDSVVITIHAVTGEPSPHAIAETVAGVAEWTTTGRKDVPVVHHLLFAPELVPQLAPVARQLPAGQARVINGVALPNRVPDDGSRSFRSWDKSMTGRPDGSTPARLARPGR